MKLKLVNVFGALALSVFTLSCNDKAKEADTTEAEEAAMSDMEAAKYAVVPAESTLEWKGFKPTGTHNGTIEIETGTLTMEDGDITSGTFMIDMNSVKVLDLEGDQKESLEKHLMGTVEGKEGDFFNVNEYPNAAFEVTGSEKMDNGKYMLSGNLNMKGKKNNISIPVTITENGDKVNISSDAFTIDRTKWDINYGSKSVFDNLGDNFINDEMELKINVTANKA